jgi:hypothetical protein
MSQTTIHLCLRLALPATLAATLLLGACGNEVTPQPVAASGGSLCLADFTNCVDPIFDATLHAQTGTVTCSAGGCHAQSTGSGGAFKIYPDAEPGSSEMMSNFITAESFADLNDPPDSLLLEKPTAGENNTIGGHAGGNIFPNASDPCHVAIQTWISNRVSDPNAAVCGACTAPVISTCGY